MSPDRLFATIKQEMRRNKKKSAILGVMCLVAAYFWVPLVWGWIVPSGADEDSPEAAATADFVVAVESPAEAASPEIAPPPRRRRSIPWDELLRSIEEDPHMGPAELALLQRSPFAMPKAATEPTAIVEANQPSQTFARQQPQRTDLELELTGIVYGTRFRVATINGTEYHENDLLRIAGAARETEDSWTGRLSTADDAGEPAGSPVSRNAAERYARGEISIAELLEMQTHETNRDPTTRDEVPTSAASQGTASTAPDGDTVRELKCRVKAIRPHHVVLQFDDGTTRELRLEGARMSAGDMIQVSKRQRLP